MAPISINTCVLYSGPDFELNDDFRRAVADRDGDLAVWPQVTCPRCGCIFDTAADVVCPECGAQYEVEYM